MPKFVKFTPNKLKYLKTLLDYDPESGIFTWKVFRNSHGGGIYPGAVAGTKGEGRIMLIIDGLSIRAHTLAWWFMKGGAVPKGLEIDHEDGDDSNNKWTNLRLATRSQNNHNRHRLLKRNKSGCPGVSVVERNGRVRWLARVSVNKKLIELGCYENLEDAIAARKLGERAYFGEFCPDGYVGGSKSDMAALEQHMQKYRAESPERAKLKSQRLKALWATQDARIAQSKRISKARGSSSGCVGVFWVNLKRHWRAMINVDGKRIILGGYPTKAAAIRARKEAEHKYYERTQ